MLHCDKPGTGLIDAPRAFSMKLAQVTEKICGLIPTSVDNELTAKHVNNQLVALLAKHVDDLKVCGFKKYVDLIFFEIGKVFGDLKVDRNEFTNCGVRHIQDPTTKEVTLDQIEYIKCLKPIIHPELSGDSETDCSPELQALYMSLLGAACYCLMTRLDAAVYLTALQRMMQQAKIIHIKRLNAVVRWLQRVPKMLCYPRLDGLRTELLLISDAAFKKEEEDKIMWHSAYGGEPRMTLGYVVYNEEIWKNMVEDIAGKALVWPLAPFDPSMLPKDSPSYMP